MKIGEDALGVSKKDATKIVSLVIIGYILLGVLMDWLFDRSLEAWYYYLVKGVLFGVFFSLVFYFFLKKMTKGVLLQLDLPLEEGEVLEAYGVANLFLNRQAIGGKLGITQDYLLFHSHKFNFTKKTVRIAFADIQHIKPCKTMGLIDNGVKVILADQTCRFVVNDRTKWMELLQEKLK
ncbi:MULTISPECIES: hypothetical protein [unclassified Myroides]|uniref:hypothetical protein n=1 Tax=unclassified Myroides TaxID=2642485 RepID=UPI0015F7D6A9|nr:MULTISPECIES: hypothetical protein [unclassified Myroides]MBB1149588.1 hypothetical protein [Myroides sp. NP-2]MDM1407018.1 hypothetical protein [Myroides sp. DF42-4-2]